MESYTALAVPFYLLGIALEFFWARRKNKKLYRLSDFLSNLSCGLSSELMGVFCILLFVWLYKWVSLHFSLPIKPPEAPLPAFFYGSLVFLGIDLIYYWWHRLSHEMNLLWAGHVVHHQSEDYNLSVALRQSGITNLTVIPFYLLFAFLGVPLKIFLILKASIIIYQFWIHTRLIKRMGFFEAMMNTPSHHRVHHGIEPKYIDKNYAGVFIIWDKLFGTFQAEEEEPTYGTVKPFASWNSLWAQFHYFFAMRALARSSDSFRSRVKLLYKAPGWNPSAPAEIILIPEPSKSYVKYGTTLSVSEAFLSVGLFTLWFAGSLVFLHSHFLWQSYQVLLFLCISIVTMIMLGKILEGASFLVPKGASALAINEDTP